MKVVENVGFIRKEEKLQIYRYKTAFISSYMYIKGRIFGIMQILLALLVYTQKMLFNFILCIKNNACVQFSHILLSAR